MMVCCLALAEEFISITVAILASTAANCSLSWLILQLSRPLTARGSALSRLQLVLFDGPLGSVR